jgi:ATP-dependent DNA helicase RecG
MRGTFLTSSKGKRIQPAKLQETFVAFANADGGDIYVGIEDKKVQGQRLQPFVTMEEANSIISVLLEQTTPSVENVVVEFLKLSSGGYILHFSIPKSTKVHYASAGDCYVRLVAEKIKIKGERVTSLAYSKGSNPYERVAVSSVGIEDIADSPLLADYMRRVETSIEAPSFLRKQRLLPE